MKTLELKVSKETVFGRDEEIILTTYHLTRECINKQSQNGFSIEEMMQRLRLLGIVDVYKNDFTLPKDMKAKDVPQEFLDKIIPIQFEDADYEVLKQLVKSMRWGIPSQFIVDFVKSFD